MPQLALESFGQTRITVAPDGGVALEGQDQILIPGTSFFVGDEKIADAFGSVLPPVLADLVDIAMATYLADRLVRRRAAGVDRYAHQWRRNLHVCVPVRKPSLWKRPSIRTHLHAALALFTDDDWYFEFLRHPGGRRSAEIGGHLFKANPNPPVRCALFSGGLDSLAGLCVDLSEHDGTQVLFSGSTNHRLLSVQRHLSSQLRAKFRRDIIPVMVPFGFQRRGVAYHGDERTQRCRGFVFACLGAATAIMAGVDSLAVFENGVGAINLPYMANQLGTQATRAVNPHALSALANLLGEVTGAPFAITTPFIFHTKAQLCRQLDSVGGSDLIRGTISCDGFPQRVPGRSQCGWCTSCLLRRQSLHAAGLAHIDVADQYRRNVFSRETSLPSKQLLPVNAMLGQVATLNRALLKPKPWEALTLEYPMLLEVEAALRASDSRRAVDRELTTLYRTYVEEWRSLESYEWAGKWFSTTVDGGRNGR